MIIDGIEVRKIRTGENNACVGSIPGPAVACFNGNPYCAACFGAEILDGEHRYALLGHFFSLLLDD
jgi:hypothetical protein